MWEWEAELLLLKWLFVNVPERSLPPSTSSSRQKPTGEGNNPSTNKHDTGHQNPFR